jgi:hypothetical protein
MFMDIKYVNRTFSFNKLNVFCSMWLSFIQMTFCFKYNYGLFINHS